MDGMAQSWSAHATALFAVRGTLEPGSTGNGFQGRRRDVARRLRYDAGAVQRRVGTFVAAGAAAIFVFTYLCPRTAGETLRTGSGTARRTDSSRSLGQPLGATVGWDFSLAWLAGEQPRLRSY